VDKEFSRMVSAVLYHEAAFQAYLKIFVKKIGLRGRELKIVEYLYNGTWLHG
jgi:hypothetical protein